MTYIPFQPRKQTQDYRTIAEVFEYDKAENIIHALLDGGFPVKASRIVGVNLETVERITGRLSTLKVLRTGALNGLAWGFFLGIILALLNPSIPILHPILFGAVFGAVVMTLMSIFARTFGRHARRDFSSIRSLEPHSYEIQVQAQYVNSAYSTLQRAGIWIV